MEKIRQFIESKQYTLLRKELTEYNHADIAELLEELPKEEAFQIFRLLPKDMAADVFSYLPIDLEQMVIISLTDREAANIVDNLMADDARFNGRNAFQRSQTSVRECQPGGKESH